MKKAILTVFICCVSRFLTFAQWTNQTGTGNYYLTSGYAGIGTATPAQTLTVLGGAGTPQTSGTSQSGIFRLNNGSNDLALDFGQLATFPYTSWIQNTNKADLSFNYALALNPNGGNVGIGTTNPAYTLDVNGSGNFNGTISANHSTLNISGDLNTLHSNLATTGYALTNSPSGSGWVYVNTYTNSTDQTYQLAYDCYQGNRLYTRYSADGSSTWTTWTKILNQTDVNGTAGYVPKFTSLNAVGNGSIYDNGNVGIGTTTPDEKLAVNGTIHSQEVKVDLTGWEDKVFKRTYKLPALSTVKIFIDLNHHLPDMPSENELVKTGLNLGNMEKILTKKVEELTLYMIEKDKQVTDQQKEIDQLKMQLNTLSKEIHKN